eukprot:TRINITY_DN6043_c0_g3_i2.p1 TRINITY_DN6043_c0_g3~~TRINITY_DN6043_c0_g3_i2.p1  ORF type:complete len:235 (-),score=-10.82 TRINITY_DN6043_c0_g3_i2:721-1425(-)
MLKNWILFDFAQEKYIILVQFEFKIVKIYAKIYYFTRIWIVYQKFCIQPLLSILVEFAGLCIVFFSFNKISHFQMVTEMLKMLTFRNYNLEKIIVIVVLWFLLNFLKNFQLFSLWSIDSPGKQVRCCLSNIFVINYLIVINFGEKLSICLSWVNRLAVNRPVPFISNNLYSIMVESQIFFCQYSYLVQNGRFEMRACFSIGIACDSIKQLYLSVDLLIGQMTFGKLTSLVNKII